MCWWVFIVIKEKGVLGGESGGGCSHDLSGGVAADLGGWVVFLGGTALCGSHLGDFLLHGERLGGSVAACLMRSAVKRPHARGGWCFRLGGRAAAMLRLAWLFPPYRLVPFPFHRHGTACETSTDG